jgi:hypothetical protein
MQFDASHDYGVLNRAGLEPANVMNSTGTWDYPIIILSTPKGMVDLGRPRPDVQFLLIEGHLRMRYLNALSKYGQPAYRHSVFVLRMRGA